ncbi:hypothetical protein ACU4GD_17855 [Cupriavidus basilensis]
MAGIRKYLKLKIFANPGRPSYKDVSDEGLRSEKGVRLNHALGSVTEFEYRYDFRDD